MGGFPLFRRQNTEGRSWDQPSVRVMEAGEKLGPAHVSMQADQGLSQTMERLLGS